VGASPCSTRSGGCDVRWASDSVHCLVQTYDRFVTSLWLLELPEGRRSRLDTNEFAVPYFDQATNGEISLAQVSASFAGRIFKRPADSTAHLLQIYDANPQLCGASARAAKARNVDE